MPSGMLSDAKAFKINTYKKSRFCLTLRLISQNKRLYLPIRMNTYKKHREVGCYC